MEEKEDDEYHHDQIRTLPDEVLSLILMKVSDPKSLLRCSLVSKHLASILFHSHSLSLQFPSSSITVPIPTYPNPKSSTRFLLKPFRFLRRNQITTPSPPSLEYRFNVVDEDELLFRLTKLLSRFTNVRSLCLELPCSPPTFCPCKPTYFQFSWVFNVGKKLFPLQNVPRLSPLGLVKNGCKQKLKTFAFLSTSSILEIDDEVVEEGSISSEQPQNYSRGSDHHLQRTASSLVLYATLINRTLLLLFSRHPNIESVKIMDSKKHGEVNLQGEQLLKLKNSMSKSMPPNLSEETVMNMNLLPNRFGLWYAEKLRLRRSGFVMEGVTLGVGAVDKFPGEGDIEGLVADFEENGDGVFGEALTQIHTSDSLRCQSFFTLIYQSKLRVQTIRGFSDMDP